MDLARKAGTVISAATFVADLVSEVRKVSGDQGAGGSRSGGEGAGSRAHQSSGGDGGESAGGESSGGESSGGESSQGDAGDQPVAARTGGGDHGE
jgi:hypothetical protein